MAPITKGGWLLLLQAATTLFSGVSARCNSCKASDELLVLLRAEDVHSEALPFCSSVLGLPVSTVEITATEEVVITVTKATTVTQVVSDISSVTVTISAPVVPTTTAQAATVTVYKKRRRDTAIASYPTWLPSGPEAYPDFRISSACHCLDKSSAIPVSTTTVTHIDPDNAITVTKPATSTVISTLLSTVTATETLAPPAPPAPSSTTITNVMIQVFRKSTGASVGWLYDSNGPAIATDPTIARHYDISIPEFDVDQSGSQARISAIGGDASKAVGFTGPASIKLEDYYGSVSNVGLTSPGTPYVCEGNNCWASDIWAINTQTKAVTWNWIVPNGGNAPAISMWRVGGRLYPVGNLALFQQAVGSVSAASRYEIEFRYVKQAEAAPAKL
ncbi:hypothetical protein QBC36DRAFT_241031 [Triangularia setosa]|uniref:Uncharacterized protein n=1 Tax=Triangularia setosa TaxID=2587417 RepID=A0AAN6W5C0_9PEZI|nr:hypothetical protein QBC36DRAFT_241031 [Podospora setosa]